MSEKASTVHAIRRTSPKGPGMPFIGVCTQCGTPGLTLADFRKPCPNQRQQTIKGAILEAVKGTLP